MLGVISARADIDQIDSDLLYLPGKDLALFQTPRKPFAVLVLFISRPFRPADSDRKRLVGPRLADPLDQPKRPADAVLQALATELVGPCVGDRREERREEVSMGRMNLNEVESDLLASLDGGDVSIFNPLDVILGHHDGLRVTIAERNVTGAVNYSIERVNEGLIAKWHVITPLLGQPPSSSSARYLGALNVFATFSCTQGAKVEALRPACASWMPMRVSWPWAKLTMRFNGSICESVQSP